MKSVATVSSFAAVALVSSAGWAQAVGGSIEVTAPPPPSAQAQVDVQAPQQQPPQQPPGYYGQQPVYAQPQPVYAQPQPVYGQPQPVYSQPPSYYQVHRPYALPYNGGPVPAGSHVETRAQYGWIGGGAGLFGGAWFPTIFALLVQGSEFVAIPVVGPIVGGIMDIGGNDPGLRFLGAWGVIDGLAQIGGIVMFAYGIASPRRLLVADYAMHTPRNQPVRWAVLPGITTMTGSAPGATLSLTNF